LMRRRSLSAIRAELAAVSDDDRDAIYTFLAERIAVDEVLAPRFLHATGQNAGAIFALYTMGKRADRPRGAARRLSLEIAALWAQDNPRDFVHPAWRPELCVWGSVPV